MTFRPAPAGVSSSSFTVGLISALTRKRGTSGPGASGAGRPFGLSSRSFKRRWGRRIRSGRIWGDEPHQLPAGRRYRGAAADHGVAAQAELHRLGYAVFHWNFSIRTGGRRSRSRIRSAEPSIRTDGRVRATKPKPCWSIRARSLVEIGRLLHETWQLKRGLADCVSNSRVDAIYEAATHSRGRRREIARLRVAAVSLRLLV